MMTPSVKHHPSGAVEIIVEHPESDSLAILTVRHGSDTLTVEVGLRGNGDAKERPIRRTYVRMKAKLVSETERARRKAAWRRDNAWRFR